jgi:general secretion pathway protein G
MKKFEYGVTLIELLVVITIIGMLAGFVAFSFVNPPKQARDATRKSDLELIRSGLEIYKADCDSYPATAKIVAGAALNGSGSSASCSASNTYISIIPSDPTSTRTYSYTLTGNTYTLCAALEVTPSPAMAPTPDCGSCTVACNYRVTNP